MGELCLELSCTRWKQDVDPLTSALRFNASPKKSNPESRETPVSWLFWLWRGTDGSCRVYVRLTYKESFATYSRPPDPANTFHWHVAATVIPEDGRFVVDDILQFKDDSTEIESRLSDAFVGCNGSQWVGNEKVGSR